MEESEGEWRRVKESGVSCGECGELLDKERKVMENKGIFLYLDSINALDTLWSDALKWRIVRAVTMYAALGELPDEKLQKNTAFLFLKSVVDNGKTGQKRKKGGVCEKEVKSLDNTDNEASFCGGEKVGESDDKHILCGEEKLDENLGEKLQRVNNNKNKNENKNKNKTETSSSCESEQVSEVEESFVQVEEEEKKRESRVVAFPTLAEVENFISVTKVKVDPVCFFEYHVAKNWKVGGRNVTDWRACVLEWDRRTRRKEAREKEREDLKKIKDYTKEELDEINNSFVDLSSIKNMEDLFN